MFSDMSLALFSGNMGYPLRKDLRLWGFQCSRSSRSPWEVLERQLDEDQEMPILHLYHGTQQKGTREELRAVAGIASLLHHETQDASHRDRHSTRSGKFAQSREPLDVRVKRQQVQTLDVACNGGGTGEGYDTYRYHEKPHQ